MNIIRIQSVKLLSILLILSSLCYGDSNNFLKMSERNQFQLSTSMQTQSSSISTNDSETSVKQDAKFSLLAQSVTGDYFINEKFSLSFSYLVALVLDIDAEVQGFDFGVHYYPLSGGASKDIKVMGSYIKASPGLTPFVYLGASTRDYQFSTVNLRFQGLTIKGGADWHLYEEYFVRGSLFGQYQLNNNVRVLSTYGISIGLGHRF